MPGRKIFWNKACWLPLKGSEPFAHIMLPSPRLKKQRPWLCGIAFWPLPPTLSLRPLYSFFVTTVGNVMYNLVLTQDVLFYSFMELVLHSKT